MAICPAVRSVISGAPALGALFRAKEIVMTRKLATASKTRRFSAVVAALALAGLLAGCVVYPAGPGYYGHPHYWHDRDRDWR